MVAALAWRIFSVLDQNRSKSGSRLSVPSDIAAEKGHCGRNRRKREHSFRKCPTKRRLTQNVSLENSHRSRNGAQIGAGFQIVSFRLGIAPDRVRPNDSRHPLPAGDVFRLFLHSSSCSVSRSGWPQESWAAAEGRREQSRGGQKPRPDEKKGKPGDRLRSDLNHSGPRAPRAATGGPSAVRSPGPRHPATGGAWGQHGGWTTGRGRGQKPRSRPACNATPICSRLPWRPLYQSSHWRPSKMANGL